jgi:hypothetical protein
MKNSIILAFSIIASTIAPIVLIPETAFAQNSVDTTSCAALPQESKAPEVLTSATPLGTAKDLMLGGPQKVNVRCFITGDGEKVPPMQGLIVIEMPKPDQLELIRIRF